MKKLNILLLLILSLGSNAKNLNSNLTGVIFDIVDNSGAVVCSLGNSQTLPHIPFYHLNVTLTGGLYRFRYWGSSTDLTYLGGIGFPSGTTTNNPSNFIYVPAGIYNIYLNNNQYSFVIHTTHMLVGNRFSYSLSDMGDGSYCATNLVFDYYNWNYIYFQLTGVEGGLHCGISSFPSGQLVSNSSFLVPPGTYTVCVGNDMSFSFTNSLNVEEVNFEKASVYPNPTENEWNLKLKNNSKNTIEIYNCLGKKVNEYTFIGDTFSINSTTLSSGIYFAHILSDNDLTVVKLIKK